MQRIGCRGQGEGSVWRGQGEGDRADGQGAGVRGLFIQNLLEINVH